MVKNGDDKDEDCQLADGAILRGDVAHYQVCGRRLGQGVTSETYRAKATVVQRVGEGVEVGRQVVIKIPRLPMEWAYERKKAVLTEIEGKLSDEYRCLQHLGKVDGVAHVLDIGTHPLSLQRLRIDNYPSKFMVQEFVRGKGLKEYLLETFPRSHSCGMPAFSGIPDAGRFFEWARKLSKRLLDVHRAQVVHGDVWPPNIMVNGEEEPVYIDFGEAVFRDLVVAEQQVGESQAKKRYVAPEKTRSVAGDIYSLGGVMFYLATGQDPPEPEKDIDTLKIKIAKAINASNPGLYNENCGVVDVIARCLRFHQHNRVLHAEGVLQDIETFSPSQGQSGGADCIMQLSQTFAGLEMEQETRPFYRMVSLRVRLLEQIVAGMARGVYDLVGDHEDIVSGLTQYLSFLVEGDQYLTVSLPSFWHERNLGVNGRFLAMNRLAAQRGATVRRIFLVTRADVKGGKIDAIIASHLAVMNELMQLKTAANPPRGSYQAYFVVMEPQERLEAVRTGDHFGLMLLGNGPQSQTMLIAPLYREDGTIYAIQFRSHCPDVEVLKSTFEKRCRPERSIDKYEEFARTARAQSAA